MAKSGKNVSAQQLGREGGKKGGKARAENTTAAQRKEIAAKGGKSKAYNQRLKKKN